MSKNEYKLLAYESLRSWLKELNTNKHGLAHLAELAISTIKTQIKLNHG